jgi:predicted protein tyrosine phosphatase
MNILVCDHTEAAERCRFRKFDVILVKDPGEENPYTKLIQKAASACLVLEFEDLELQHPGRRMPEKSDIIQALNWAKGRDSFIVACPTGCGRAPALAFVLLCTEMSASEAAEFAWDPATHSPNERVVSLGAELLKNKDLLVERAKLAEADLDLVDHEIQAQEEVIDNTPFQVATVDPLKKNLILQQFGITFR